MRRRRRLAHQCRGYRASCRGRGAALVGSTLDAAAIDKAVQAAVGIAQPSQGYARPGRFRKSVAGVMVRRAIEAAAARAQ